MNNYENITNQTIQLFPQLFLGKHGLLRVSQLLVKPSDNAGGLHSSHGVCWLGVRPKDNVSERSLSVVKRKRPGRERGSNTLSCSVQVFSQRRDGSSPDLRKPLTDGIQNDPKDLDKRQSAMNKVTSSRPFRAVYSKGRLTGNGMPIAAGVRDEEEANACGNAQDRAVPPPPFQGAGTHPSWCNASRRLQVILHKKTTAEP